MLDVTARDSIFNQLSLLKTDLVILDIDNQSLGLWKFFNNLDQTLIVFESVFGVEFIPELIEFEQIA